MKRLAQLFLCLSLSAWAKDIKQVKVVATHAVTHEARDTRAIMDRGIMGAHTLGRQVESFNLDTEIDGEKVLLACDDDKGCEAPELDTYEAELRRGGHIRVNFTVPVTHKKVGRWYRIAGSW
jgi:hypothetical protein